MVKNRNKVKKPAKNKTNSKMNSTLKMVIDILLSQNFHIALTFVLGLGVLGILIFTYFFNNNGDKKTVENFKLPKHYIPLKNSEEIQENYEEQVSPAPLGEFILVASFVLLFSSFTGNFVNIYKNGTYKGYKKLIPFIFGVLFLSASLYNGVQLIRLKYNGVNTFIKSIVIIFLTIFLFAVIGLEYYGKLTPGNCSESVTDTSTQVVINPKLQTTHQEAV